MTARSHPVTPTRAPSCPDCGREVSTRVREVGGATHTVLLCEHCGSGDRRFEAAEGCVECGAPAWGKLVWCADHAPNLVDAGRRDY